MALSTRTIHLGWSLIGWVGVALILYLSLMPHPPELDIEQGDKLQHMAAYTVLMGWWAQMGASDRANARIALVILVLGIAIEFMQAGTGYRTFSVADMVADALGIALGWMLAPPRGPNLLRLTTTILGSDPR